MLGIPVVAWIATHDHMAVAHALHEYVAFIVLLGALFVIAGGVVLRGTLSGTPGLNALLLGVGAVLASIVGTTGASMLLDPPAAARQLACAVGSRTCSCSSSSW